MSEGSPLLKQVAEAALLVAGRSLSLDNLRNLFDEVERPDRGELRAALVSLQDDFSHRGIELAETASGYRVQVRSSVNDRVARLFEEKPKRYSRALLETLALIAYRQPLTRGEIEDVRGVSVSSTIMKTLQERGWVRIVGHRDVPGRPALYATTRDFLDYFGLRSLDELPTLAELRDIDSINVEIDFEGTHEPGDDRQQVDTRQPERSKTEESGEAAQEAACGDTFNRAERDDARDLSESGASSDSANATAISTQEHDGDDGEITAAASAP